MNRQLIYLFFFKARGKTGGWNPAAGTVIRTKCIEGRRPTGVRTGAWRDVLVWYFGSRSGYVIRSTPSRSQQLVCLLRLIS